MHNADMRAVDDLEINRVLEYYVILGASSGVVQAYRVRPMHDNRLMAMEIRIRCGGSLGDL